MKKTADILLRIILVVSILGAIFFYYFGRFVTNKKTVIISQKVILPPYPEIKKVKVKSEKEKKIKKLFKVIIADYPVKDKIIKIINFAKNFKNVKIQQSSQDKIVYFKRLFVGPFKTKKELTKIEKKLKKINIEPLIIKLRGYYFLHCGSFYFDKSINETKEKLFSVGIKNITVFKTKKKLHVYNIIISDLNEKDFKKLQEFLSQNKVEFRYESYTGSWDTERKDNETKK